VRETLQAAPGAPETREDLARGRLTKELSGGAFDFTGFPDVPAPKRSRRGAEPRRATKNASTKKAEAVAPPEPSRSDDSRRELRKARADLEAATRRAEAAERRHERAQAAFFAAEEKRDEARKGLEDALSERDGLEATVRRLERD